VIGSAPAGGPGRDEPLGAVTGVATRSTLKDMNGGFDLRVAGVPVRVMWMFFFVTFLIGSSFGDPVRIGAWMAVAFVSILVHEMGHAFAYRAFGVEPTVALHGFGGSTFGRSLPVGRDLVVSLAGPVTGLVIGLPALVVANTVPVTSALVANVIAMVVWVNVWWSLVNLLPMLPLDGGNATNAGLSLLFRRDMTHPTRVISVSCWVR
jgi:Zn-dependent protease